MTSKKRVGKLTRASADKHDLYQRSVQEPEADVDFFKRVFRSEFRRRAHTLREDFCGTGWLSCTWAQDHPKNVAYGYDIDRVPLAWGEANNVSKVKPAARERVFLREGNALQVAGPKVDIVAGLNFSYFCFKERKELGSYCKAAFRNLGTEGLFILDIEGGRDTHSECQETRKVGSFTYVWTQEKYNPIAQHAICSIGFRFQAGGEWKRAFTYDWRIWNLPEVRELMLEAGFERVDVYWEGTDRKTDEGNGVFTRREVAEQCDAWIAYVVGVKRKSAAGRRGGRRSG